MLHESDIIPYSDILMLCVMYNIHLFFRHETRPTVMLFQNLRETTVAHHNPVVEQQELRVNLAMAMRAM